MKRPVVVTLTALALLATTATIPGVFASGSERAAAHRPARADSALSKTSSTAATGKITFSTPSVVDTVHTYGEPDIITAPDGTVYDSGPWGTGTQRSIWNQSTDGGRTFHSLHDTAISSPEESDTQHAGPGGGDTELSIDHTNKVYYADLAALASLKVATWDRSTRTMQTSFFGNGQQNANGIDRQWFALWDPKDPDAVRAATGYTGPLPVNYLSYGAATGSLGCTPPVLGGCAAIAYSTDGLTYSADTATWPQSAHGPHAIDQDTGTVFEPIAPQSGQVGVAILTRDPSKPDDPALVNVDVVKIADLPSGADVGALFPVIGEDAARNVYVAWVASDQSTTAKASPGIWQMYYSYATAASAWKDWSAPKQISKPPANTNIMPWMVAGSEGRAAVVWYGTKDATHNPSTDDVHQAWYLYLSYLTNANSATPTIKQMKVTRHPMHYGSICLGGTGCIAQNPPGNRNLADFFEVQVDPRSGALIVTYDDTSNNLKQHDPSGSSAPPEQVAHTGAPVVTAIKQNGGIGLFGRPVKGLRTFGASLTDKRKDAAFDPIYSTTSIRQLDYRSFRVKKLKKQLLIRMNLTTLKDLQPAFDATQASAIGYVARWLGPATTKAPGTDGLTNPIYYAAAEVQSGSNPSFFAGLARSIELCSVSGCFPHIMEYPEPPYAGTSIKGKLVVTKGAKPDFWILRVPLKVIGNLRRGQLLEDFGVYVYARNKPASVPLTNSEAEGGVTPVMVDGVCCTSVRLR
jgi:hypothetical protein